MSKIWILRNFLNKSVYKTQSRINKQFKNVSSMISYFTYAGSLLEILVDKSIYLIGPQLKFTQYYWLSRSHSSDIKTRPKLSSRQPIIVCKILPRINPKNWCSRQNFSPRDYTWFRRYDLTGACMSIFLQSSQSNYGYWFFYQIQSQ